MGEKLAVVKRYENAEVAHLDRITLEEAGIKAILENENLAAVSLYHVLPRCEVRLLVQQGDLPEAQHTLAEAQLADSAIIEEAEWAESEENKDQDRDGGSFYRELRES